MKDAPKTIYLQVCEENECDSEFWEHEGVTWCGDKINDSDIEYTRADISQQPSTIVRTWIGLDPEEIRKTNHHMVEGAYHYSFKQGAEWAEATLKERNK
jgi:hypothetical protein